MKKRQAGDDLQPVTAVGHFPTFKAATPRHGPGSRRNCRRDDAARVFQEGDCMTEQPFDAGALVDAAAPLVKIAVTPESRIAVVLHLEIAAEQAALLLSAEIGDEDEPASVFRP